MLDETARRQIRQRLADLDEEIAEADAWADPERASRARAERDALVERGHRRDRPGGRARRLGDQDERARKAVTARIRDVIGRIERVHPPLGAHLRATRDDRDTLRLLPAGADVLAALAGKALARRAPYLAVPGDFSRPPYRRRRLRCMT